MRGLRASGRAGGIYRETTLPVLDETGRALRAYSTRPSDSVRTTFQPDPASFSTAAAASGRR
jgi:hypothetical protein